MNHGIPLYSSEQTVLSYDFVLFSYNLYYYSHHFYMNYTIFIHHINLKKSAKKAPETWPIRFSDGSTFPVL
ncbi:hypothetical protein CK1_36930 [Ruminococcus sp. SR1/5]|nr:hypothetical protein CK1_36930 [Ruminococcus sp. SR1/5]